MGIGESIGRKGTHWTQIHVQNQAASRWEHTAIQSKLKHQGSDYDEIFSLVSCFEMEFEMSDLGVLQYLFGLQVKQLEDGTDLADSSHYRSLIGGLNYLTYTRPDIMFFVSMLSRYMQEPTKQHLGAAERVLRYVVGIVDFGTWYFKDANFSLINSDWVGSIDNKNSTTGNVFN
ncbi:uncharacterized mitochondrial protein AtMg00810-like [Solanum lycopersicum]|uniref:uncharacterized mitochondrial protein AtMg00810-like n=1 Tax=Solanum lycopersicum TaxID=4081 RepID=UPI0037492BBA